MLLVLTSGIFMQFHIWSSSSILSLPLANKINLYEPENILTLKIWSLFCKWLQWCLFWQHATLRWKGFPVFQKLCLQNWYPFQSCCWKRLHCKKNVMSTLRVTRNEEHILISISFMYWNVKSHMDLKDCTMTYHFMYMFLQCCQLLVILS
jgi:hypothetical protein